MRSRRIRQHIREFFARDWLEITIAAFGVLMLGIGVFSVFVVVYAIIHFGESGGTFKATTSWLKGASGGAIALFSIVALGCFIGFWALTGKRMVRGLQSAIRSRRHRA